MSASAAASVQSFTPGHPCAICGGHERMQRGQGVRCHGFLSSDGRYAHCSREEYTGELALETETETYAHRLDGPCRCGVDHVAVTPAKPAVDMRPIGVGRVVATYTYTDEKGSRLFEVRRLEPKGFQQARIDPDGTPVCERGCMKDVRLVPYRLPEVINAVAAGDRIYICEGEKDADAARDAGLVATCNPGGAGKWRDDYSQFLRGGDITIVRDKDRDGHHHAGQVATSLQGIARSIQVVEAKKGKDLSDHLEAGHTIEELITVEEDDDHDSTQVAREPLKPGAEIRLTDLGNARRLVERHGRDVRYCPDWNRWLYWDDICWKTDEDGELMRCAKATVARMYEEAALARDENGRKDLAGHAIKSESEKSLKAMISLATSEPGIPVRSHELDQKPMLLGAPNGVIDLAKGVLVEPRREDFITKRVAVSFDAGAVCPIWEGFLETILPDPAVRDFYQRAVGYSLTGLTVEQVLFLMYGGGANGKSTATETLLDTFGDYATKTPRDTLLARRDTGIPNDVARLRGARFVAAVELEEGRRLAEGRVKELTGGDTVSARFMRGEWFDFRPELKLWIATNHKPEIRGTDHAIWRRIRLLPFTVTIPDDEQDHALPAKLRKERPGILRWAVEGCLAWQREGLAAPSAVLAATEEYRQEEDTLGAFFTERCVFGDGYRVAAGALREEYTDWCEATGEKFLPGKRFAAALKDHDRNCRAGNRGFGRSGARGWHGVGLRGGD